MVGMPSLELMVKMLTCFHRSSLLYEQLEFTAEIGKYLLYENENIADTPLPYLFIMVNLDFSLHEK